MDMQANVRTALVSYQIHSGDVTANWRMVENVLEANTGIDLFVLPELSLCGMPPSDTAWTIRIAEKVPDGPSSRQMSALAQRYQTIICAGIMEVDDDAYFVTHFLSGPNGYIGKQQKLFPSRGLPEAGIIHGGNGVCRMELFGLSCAVLACADWMLPEGPYLASLQDAALLLAPTDVYHLSQLNLLRQIGQARAFDAKACLVVAFGRDSSSSEEAPLGLVFNSDGTSQVETSTGEEARVMVVDLCLRPPRHRWGSPFDRVRVIKEAIQ